MKRRTVVQCECGRRLVLMSDDVVGTQTFTRDRVMWAIMSRSGHNNISERTLSPLRYEAWDKFFEGLDIVTMKGNAHYESHSKKVRWYKRHWKAVKVVLVWKVE